MENLPDDLLSNIFIRLLAKQLAQMRSVSKSWKTLLSQPSFIKSYLHRSVQNNDQILLVFYRKICSSHSKPFAAHSSRSPYLELTEFNIFLPVNPETGSTKNIRVIGAINGLICSSYDDSIIHIWNPSLSALSTLPPYHMPPQHLYKIRLRFGFDPKANDYKVVKIMGRTRSEPPSSYDKNLMQIEVYSMRKGSWELITERFPSRIAQIFDEGDVCLDGHDSHLHWLGLYFRGKTCTQTIVAFDLRSDSFREIPLPDSIPDHEDCANYLGVLAGKLCVMSWDGDVGCEVWVMDEYGVAESWVRRHVFSLGICVLDSYGLFTSHLEFLIKDSGDRLVLYDPIADETKIFENFGSRTRHRPQKIVEYVGSLVWVDSRDVKYDTIHVS